MDFPRHHIKADDVNCLIHAYLQDCGFQHSAFVLRAEGQLDRSPAFRKHIARGELIELLSKALLYIEVEAHWRGVGMTGNCRSPFTLLDRHVCYTDPSLPDIHPLPSEPEFQPPVVEPVGAAPLKRKAAEPAQDQTVIDKRARVMSDETEMNVDSVSSPGEKIQPQTTSPVTPAAVKETSTRKSKYRRPAGPADDLTSPNAVIYLKEHKTEVFVCAWNPHYANIFASGSKDGTVYFWDLPNPSSDDTLPPPPISNPTTLLYTPKGDQTDLTSMDWSPDGSLLALGSYDAVLRICKPSGELYFSFTQHQGHIFAVRFSQSGNWLLSGSLDGTVCVWDVAGKKLYKQYRCHQSCCLDVDWITDDIFASCGQDGNVQIMQLSSTEPIKTLIGHTTEVNQVKCNPSKTRLGSCSDDHTARIWNIEGLPSSSSDVDDVLVLRGHTHNVCCIAWSPHTVANEHELFATASFDGASRLWDTVTGECLMVFKDHKQYVYALAFSPDARMFATGGADGWLHVYDVKTGDKRWSWYAGSEAPGIFEVDWQQCGDINRIALALESNNVAIVDISKVPLLL